ncbi:MAG: flagellar basal body P-ring formation protein FlgA, partial [Proteobacteria bacterium]|nr:flagellar basal body P-ring formation protein FlgA [Pseudomonadota bacterium]
MKSVKITLFVFLLILTLPAFSLAARASTNYYDAVITTRTLERGHVITGADVELISTSRNDPRAARDLDSVIGMALKRTIGSDTTIKRDYLLSAASRVKGLNRGSDVVIVARRGGLRVTADGRLRQSAEIGDIVRIENLS